MDSTQAFMKLIHEETGTYILRETPQKELRFSVRSTLAKTDGDQSDNVKLVGHIIVKKDENGFGWCTGSGKDERFDTFYDIIQANKEKDDSIYQFRSQFKD